jgi:iron(III) transport system permease protein
MSARDDQRAIALCAAGGIAAFALLPWHGLGPGVTWPPLPGGLLADPDMAAGLWQALLWRRPALWPVLLALVACMACARWAPPHLRGRLLMTAGFGGALWVLGESMLGTMATQLALGWGAAAVLAALLAMGSLGLARSRSAFHGDALASTVAVMAAAVLLLFVVYPLLRGLGWALLAEDGSVNVAALWQRLANARVWSLGCLGAGTPCGVAWNTLLLALATAAGTTVLGGLLAVAELRSGWRFARAVRLLAPLSFVAPPFVAALALILLFGRSGLASLALESVFGIASGRWLYGLPGVWLAQMFAFTPIAYLILRGALAGIDPALEETARTLNATPAHAFRRITLPLMAPGLAHAFLVSFLESVADFGTPLVVGGSYAVLSTEIFYAIVGAQFTDAGRAAALACLLALFALLAFRLERAMLRNREDAAGDPQHGAELAPAPRSWRRAAVAVALPWLLLTLGLYAIALAAAFVNVWGRDFQPTLAHLQRAFALHWEAGQLVLTGLAWPSLLTSLKLAAIAAPLTVAGSLLLAWLLQRRRFAGQATLESAALMAIAVPGTVLGLCYVLVFNRPPIELAGTATLIVLCLVFRNLPVAVGITAQRLRQLDPALDEASRVMGGGSARTLGHVTLPLLRPALAAALIYSFVRCMTTLSAVVFLVTAETELATTYIVGRVVQGDWGLAFAYSTVLVLLLSVCMALASRLGQSAGLVRAARPSRVAGAPA